MYTMRLANLAVEYSIAPQTGNSIQYDGFSGQRPAGYGRPGKPHSVRRLRRSGRSAAAQKGVQVIFILVR